MPRAAFSLIETLVVVIIILTILGISIVNFRGYNDKKNLENESLKLVQTLELAKKKAISADVSTPCEGDFQGYRVEANTGSYKSIIKCSVDNGIYQTYTLPPSVEQDSHALLTVDFKALTGETTPACVRLKHIEINQCRCIQIDRIGIVREAACTNCDTCP